MDKIKDFISVIKNRRSVRIFQNKKVDREIIKKIIELATHAPSACNIQGWRFIIIEDDKLKKEIVDKGGTILIKNAPTGILVLYDNRTKNTEYMDHIQSAAATIQNLHLVAPLFGLNTCWVCHLPSKKQLKKMFKIPSYFSPIAYILIGYKKREPAKVPRKYKINNLISYNIFSSNIPIKKINGATLFTKKMLIKIYHLSPDFLRKKFLNKYIDKRFVKKFRN